MSPDYTILETTIGANEEATRKAKERGVTPPPPRIIRVDLVAGRILPAAEWPVDAAKVPVQPFKCPLADKEHRQEDYRPSLDPLRIEGRYERHAITVPGK